MSSTAPAQRKGKKRSSQPRPTKVQVDTPPSLAGYVLLTITLLGVVSLADVASQLALRPFYGGAVVSEHFQTASLAACLLSSIITTSSASPRALLSLLSVIIPSSPVLLYQVGGQTAAWNNSTWGPLVAQLVSSTPIQILAVGIITHQTTRLVQGAVRPAYLKPLIGLLCWFAIARGDQVWWDHLTFGNNITSCNMYILLTLGASFPAALLSIKDFGIVTTDTTGARSRAWRNPTVLTTLHLVIPLIISVASQSRTPCTSPALPYISGNGTVRVLDRHYSNTGLVVVGETIEQPFRYLRCDHSILGGRWMFSPAPGQPLRLDESIFSIFALQEAVRLFDRPTTRVQPRVLSIGLGVGISVDAFITHKMHTTVVEIDPAVYKFARQYFDLAEPDEVYLEDARQWVHSRSLAQAQASKEKELAQAPQPKFDFVVHDCFSGGGVPGHIFTREFWEELKTIVDDDGIVAVNFVGRFTSPAARAILVTLLTSFGSCRVFHDYPQPEEALGEEDHFLNMVYFCTPSTTPLTFRPATDEDYIGTMSRQHILEKFAEREVPFDRLLNGITPESGDKWSEWIVTDQHNMLNQWQKAVAFEHFSIMQSVLPQSVWNAF